MEHCDWIITITIYKYQSNAAICWRLYLKVCEWKMTGVQNRAVENITLEKKKKKKKNERRSEKHCEEKPILSWFLEETVKLGGIRENWELGACWPQLLSASTPRFFNNNKKETTTSPTWFKVLMTSLEKRLRKKGYNCSVLRDRQISSLKQV